MGPVRTTQQGWATSQELCRHCWAARTHSRAAPWAICPQISEGLNEMCQVNRCPATARDSCEPGPFMASEVLHSTSTHNGRASTHFKLHVAMFSFHLCFSGLADVDGDHMSHPTQPLFINFPSHLSHVHVPMLMTVLIPVTCPTSNCDYVLCTSTSMLWRPHRRPAHAAAAPCRSAGAVVLHRRASLRTMFDELVVYRPATCRPACAASVPKRNDCSVNARWYVDGTMVIPLEDGKLNCMWVYHVGWAGRGLGLGQWTFEASRTVDDLKKSQATLTFPHRSKLDGVFADCTKDWSIMVCCLVMGQCPKFCSGGFGWRACANHAQTAYWLRFLLVPAWALAHKWSKPCSA